MQKRTHLAGLAMLLAAMSQGQVPQLLKGTPADQRSLKIFLQHYEHDDPLSQTTRYSAAFVHLNTQGNGEAIVYLSGEGWCGSGGCITYVLARDGASWRFVTKMTITRPPIRVLNSISSHGWHDIAVWVEGGGIQPGYEAELRFDGKTYPPNPSMPPARPLARKAAGEVVISTLDGIPLFP